MRIFVCNISFCFSDRRRLLFVGRSLLAALLSAACSPTSDGVMSASGGAGGAVGSALQCANDGTPLRGSVSMAPISEKDFPRSFATAFCQGIASSCQASPFPYNEVDCRSTAEAHVGQVISARTSSGRMVYDGATAGQCIQLYAEALVSGSAHSNPFLTLWQACHQSLFKGTVLLGGACAATSECQQDCKAPRECDQSVCKEADSSDLWKGPRRQLGEPCSTSCTQRDDLTACSSSSSALSRASGVCWALDGLTCFKTACVALPKLGEPCEHGCEPGAYCSRFGSAATNLCVPQLAEGPCLGDSLACADSAYCGNALPASCIPKGAEGAACQSLDECTTGNCFDKNCQRAVPADAKTCSGVPNYFF